MRVYPLRAATSGAVSDSVPPVPRTRQSLDSRREERLPNLLRCSHPDSANCPHQLARGKHLLITSDPEEFGAGLSTAMLPLDFTSDARPRSAAREDCSIKAGLSHQARIEGQAKGGHRQIIGDMGNSCGRVRFLECRFGKK